MRPILIFAIAAIAASAVGVGALNNTILLTVQQFGVGSQDIESPITAANIDFEMKEVPTFSDPGSPAVTHLCNETDVAAAIDCELGVDVIVDTPAVPPSGPIFKNLITGCSFHSAENIAAPEDDPANPANDPTLICKLTDADHKIVAEGKLPLPNGYEMSSLGVIIPITDLAYPGANDFTNVHDVHLVVFGTDPTQDPFEINPNTPAP
jgi:hypothetical protein